MKTKLLSLLLFCFTITSYGQQSNDCDQAAGSEVTVNTTCVPSTFNSNNNTDYWDGTGATCTENDKDDAWIWFTGTGAATTITYTPTTNKKAELTLFEGGTCSTNMTTSTIKGCGKSAANMAPITINYTTVLGTIYRIRLQRDNNDGDMLGNICVFAPIVAPPTCSDGIQNGTETGIDCGGTCPPCVGGGGNDDPCGATSLPVGVVGVCTFVTSTNAGATATAGVTAPGCASYSGGDVWFSVVVPASGNLVFDSNTGVMTDGGMAIYSGTCGALTLVDCDDDGSSNGLMPMIEANLLTPGSTIFIRMWEYGNNNNGTFSICVTDGGITGVCGNIATNDFCSDPGILTQGVGTWNNTTTGTYTSDTPANLTTPFCGSIENNSWYQFTAIATSETFVFAGVGGVSCGSGIQVEIYDVATDANGCCTNFTSVSNCFNPGSQTGGTVTATGLTIGNQYYMMIDGNAGAGCDFSVTGWDVSLPIELLNFKGYSYKNGNKLRWATASEINNDYFIIQKSIDTRRYSDVGTVKGHGNSNTVHEYTFIDETSSYDVTYYRLKQIDFDGNYSFSKIVAIQSNNNIDINIFPNPSKKNFSFDIKESNDETFTIIYTNLLGIKSSEEVIITTGNNNYQVNNFVDLPLGIYFVQIINQNGEVIKSQKVIKK